MLYDTYTIKLSIQGRVIPLPLLFSELVNRGYSPPNILQLHVYHGRTIELGSSLLPVERNKFSQTIVETLQRYINI